MIGSAKLDYRSKEFEEYGKALKNVGIELYSKDNSIKSVDILIKELSQVWEDISVEAKTKVEETAHDLEGYIMSFNK